MYQFSEEIVKEIMVIGTPEEILANYRDNMAESTARAETLGELENIAYWTLSYIEVLKRKR